MKKTSCLITILILTFTLIGCTQTEELQKPTITQGVYGEVTLRSGNCMPSVWPSTNSCALQKFSTNIYITQKLDENELSSMGTIGTIIKNPTLIKQTKSNEKGFFEIELPNGTYSLIFEYEGNKYYQYTNFVVENGITHINIRINNASD